jgi:spermidine synthase
LLLSFSVGFLSLSQEILWVRLVSFGQQARPHAFSIVLAAFLIGIALGAIAGRRLCQRSQELLWSGGLVLLVAAAADFVTLYLASTALLYSAFSPRRLLILIVLISLTAGLKGVLFPIVHHLGSFGGAERVGRSVSRIYLGNVIGSTLGPIVTGFWLLDRIDIESAFALVGTLTAALGVLACAFSKQRLRAGWFAPAALLAFGVFSVARPPGIVISIASPPDRNDRVKHVIQNKHGIIHVLAATRGQGGDVTFGGNVYDGRINVDTTVNSNGLDRAYLMAVMHPNPRRALVVGVSTGAWTRIITGMPGIQTVDVVEINPGYLDLIRLYPEVSPLLSDSRVRIHIDDGRRWLRAHPNERYDLIFQNTTWHWRAYSTLLLSTDFFREVKGHLNPGGILAVNSTHSVDVFRTAQEVFPNVVRYQNFVYMSDRPLTKRQDAERVLRECKIGDKPAFEDSLFVGDGIGALLVHDRLESAQEFISASEVPEPPQVITDMNLIPEFRHGRPPLFGWLQPLLPPTPNRN